MIRHLLFDIDNTLYSASNLMERRISERMFQFIADFLSVPLEEAINCNIHGGITTALRLNGLSVNIISTIEILILRPYTPLRRFPNYSLIPNYGVF